MKAKTTIPNTKTTVLGLAVGVAMTLAYPSAAQVAPNLDYLLSRYCGGADFIKVNTFEDHEDPDGCTDNDCSLREAVNLANACPRGSGAQISLKPGTYRLGMAGFAEPLWDYEGPTDGAAKSALPIIGDIDIFANRAEIERDTAAPRFRLFEVRPGGSLRLSNATVRNGDPNAGRRLQVDDSGTSGGAILVMEGASLTLRRVVLENNRARFGGAISSHGDVSIRDGLVQANRATKSGGGLHNYGGSMKLYKVTVAGNQAEGLSATGGGLTNVGYLELKASTVSSNTSESDGAGIFSKSTPDFEAETTIVDATIFGNRVVDVDGATASFKAGGIWLGGMVRISNSMVAGNGPWDCSGDTLAGVYSSRWGNLDGDGTCTQFAGLDFRWSTEPKLYPLDSNGGFAPTHLPRVDSPLVDAGDGCGTVDQRGVRRSADGDGDGDGEVVCDIGSVERQTLLQEYNDPVVRDAVTIDVPGSGVSLPPGSLGL